MYVSLKKTRILEFYTEKKILEKKIWFLISVCLFIKYCDINNINIRLFL